MSLIEEIKEYWDLRSSDFSDSVLYDLDNSSDKIASRIDGYLSGHDIKDVLDLGCGPGFFTLALGSRGYRIVGVDYSDKMIAEARKNATDRNIDAEFAVMDAQDLGFLDSSFDLVISRNLFWCLEHPETAYREVLRVLRPGGMAIISDGNYYLHLYDEDYASSKRSDTERHAAEPAKDGHFHFNKNNVDFGIIENIARDLPLSREERPLWDVGTLMGLGCDDIKIHTYRRNGELVMSFDIVFFKGDADGNRYRCEDDGRLPSLYVQEDNVHRIVHSGHVHHVRLCHHRRFIEHQHVGRIFWDMEPLLQP